MRIRHNPGDLSTAWLLAVLGRTHRGLHELRMIERNLLRWWWWWQWVVLGLGHGPHVHRDGPVGLDHSLPHLGQNDLTIRPDKIVVALMYVRADDVDVKKGLFDELFHALNRSVRKTLYQCWKSDVPSRSCRYAMGS